MFEIDPKQLAPEISALILSRGQGVPPLQWDGRPNRIAARTLDDTEPMRLFGRPGFADEAMVDAVRGLLYLWNGWPAEAIAHAEKAPPPEACYIRAIAERQAGRADEAKRLFQQIGNHPVYLSLADRAFKDLDGTNEPLLVRFQQAIELGGLWEPYLYVDVFEMARGGKLKEQAEQVVRTLQCVEFELLFKYCYEQAVGERLVQRAAPTEDAQEARIQQLRQLADKHRARQKAAKAPEKTEKQKSDAAPAAAPGTPPDAGGVGDGWIKIGCPRCRQAVDLHESVRGQVQSCPHCGALFKVPGQPPQPTGAMPSPAPGTMASQAMAAQAAAGLHSPGGSQTVAGPQATAGLIGVRCPKCANTLMLPEAMRGRPQKCAACGAVFLVPQKKPPTPMAISSPPADS